MDGSYDLRHIFFFVQINDLEEVHFVDTELFTSCQEVTDILHLIERRLRPPDFYVFVGYYIDQSKITINNEA